MKGQICRRRSSPVSPVAIMNGTKSAACTAINPKTTIPATDPSTFALSFALDESRM